MQKYATRYLGRGLWLPGVITGIMTAISFVFIMTAALLGCRSTTAGHGAGAELLVTSFTPVESQGMAGTTAAIRIRFSGSVVEDHRVGRTLTASPARVHPPVKVAARWSDRRTLVLRPTAPMTPSTRYRVTLAGHLGVAGESRFSFVHRPLTITRLSGADPARLPRRPTLVLHFNQPVLASAVTRACVLLRSSGRAAPLITPHRGAVTSAVVLRPRRPLGRGVDYTLRCAGLRGHGGDESLARPWVKRLRTGDTRLARRRR